MTIYTRFSQDGEVDEVFEAEPGDEVEKSPNLVEGSFIKGVHSLSGGVVLSKYGVFNSLGNIVKHGVCQVELVKDQANVEEGETAFSGDLDPYAHYLVNGAILQYSEEASLEKRRVTDPFRRWNNSSMTWEVPELNLGDRKLRKLNELKQRRDEDLYGGFTWGKYEVDSDEKSRSAIFNHALSLSLLDAETVRWRLKDNSWADFSKSEFTKLASDLISHSREVMYKFEQLESLVNLSTDVEQLDAITWN